jgi:hypothetical protein
VLRRRVEPQDRIVFGEDVSVVAYKVQASWGVLDRYQSNAP